MFAVGHTSIAYLLGKGSSKALHTPLNIPLLLVLSILPDLDLAFEFFGVYIHRGPTHSIIVAALVFIPIFLVYRKKAIPYFLGLISHSLIGDFVIGGQVTLLWPLSSAEFGLHELGLPYITNYDPINAVLEVTLFLIAMLVMYRSGDWRTFFTARKSNLLLIIPVATVLLPATIGFPLDESMLFFNPTLAFAHLFFVVLFGVAIYKTLAQRCGQRQAESKEAK